MARHAIPMRGDLGATPSAQPVPRELMVRQFDPQDAHALGRLMFCAYRGTVDDHGESLAWHTAEARRTVAGEFGPVVWNASLVACSASQIVGACLVTDDRPHLLLAFALVLPQWQGQGIASALITRSASVLNACGHREWTLAVTEGNPAQRLYSRMGFVVDESLRTHDAWSATWARSSGGWWACRRHAPP